MTTLITGGAGFIGSHLALRLLGQGEKVVVLDNFNDAYDPTLKRANAAKLAEYPNAKVIEGDIRDKTLVSSLFQEEKIRRVAHLAALGNVRASIGNAPLYTDVNLVGTMNLLEAARDNNLDLFIMASTSSVYGETKLLPFVETDTADRPLAPYPASKRMAEILAYTYHNLYKMNITVLRFFNVYGPSGRPDMMPIRLMHAVTRGEPITVFNGNLQRDWTYVDDTVEGVVAALQTPLGYEIINLGVGRPISLNDFIETIEHLAGKQVIRQSVETPRSEPPITYCNNEKARRLLGFNPQVRVQDGLAVTWEWFCRTFNPVP
ncbi:MAG: GDP-mannose 4,6-dehydratase [Anaerolineae bacterium]|nr:GDP-mannose 4,6-dehydratase [Anaerolineae bacterium]